MTSDELDCPFCDSSPCQELDECLSYHACCWRMNRTVQEIVASLGIPAKLLNASESNYASAKVDRDHLLGRAYSKFATDDN